MPRTSNAPRVIKWGISKADYALIEKIVDRFIAIRRRHKIVTSQRDRTMITMDLTAVHRNTCALRLETMLAADDFNLCHDVSGISHHINRTNAELENCFLPRFAAPKRNLRGRTSRSDRRAIKFLEENDFTTRAQRDLKRSARR